jgi:2-polyprenyl-6-methoxyphenol hydroxylase-like FAD-dependent oxidoreductase
VVLTRLLGEHGEHGRSFERYEAERRERTARIVRLSALHGRIGQLRHPLAVRLREWAVRATPARVLESTLRQQLAYDAGEVPVGRAASSS